jgi:hypothetical protein
MSFRVAIWYIAFVARNSRNEERLTRQGPIKRTLAIPKTAAPWSLTNLREEADQDRRQGRQPQALRHLSDAEVAMSRQLFADILALIARLAPPAPA